ncbi:hypothetical protein JCM5350_003939 [Sporobolomyces pararoseus]
MARRRTHQAEGSRDESPPSTYLPPRRSLPIQPRSRSPAPLDFIPPSRSGSRQTRSRVPPSAEDEEYLSADEATRRMLEKWDLLDSTVSSPSRTGRRKSRVREWEEWKPEMERIRMAQVEMEQKLEEEAKAHQLASMEKDRGDKEREKDQDRFEKGKKKKLRERKSTPRYPDLERMREEDGSHYDVENPRAHSPESIPESTRAVYEDSEVETNSMRRESRKDVTKPSSELFAPRSASRRAHRNVAKSSSPAPPDPLAHRSTIDSSSQDQRAVPAPRPVASVNRSRSSRRKPRPAASPDRTFAPSTSSSAPTSSPPPSHRSRSSRNRRRPSLSPPSASVEEGSSKATNSQILQSDTDLRASATHAAEQVSEVVTNAFAKVIPGLFGMKRQ